MPKRSHSMKVESEVVAEGWIYLPYRITRAEDMKTGFQGYLWSAPHPAQDKKFRGHVKEIPYYEHDWTIFETIEDAQNDIIRRYL